MSGRIATRIQLGGPIPRRLAIPLSDAIRNEGLSLEWGAPHFSPTSEHDALAAADHGPLCLCIDDAPWGRFDDLEAFLRCHQIPFDHHNDAKHAHNGEPVRNRPGMRRPFTRTAAPDGKELVNRAPLIKAIALLERDKILQALHLLRQAIGPDVTPLHPLSFTGRSRLSPATIETRVTGV